MSELSLARLLATDPAAFEAAARAWAGLADGIDQATDDFIGASRALPDAWPEGPASQAAHAKAADLRAELNAAYNPALRIAQALEHHARAAAELRERAQERIREAERDGYRVHVASGTVAPPATTSASEAATVSGHAQSIAYELTALMERARALDASTSNAIAVNLPRPDTGFGRLSLPAITRQDVLDQRGRTPKEVHDWWESLTPEQRAQAIQDYPELVGWLDGVPAEDRDQANRLRMSRDRDNLLERQREIQARLDEIRQNVGDSRAGQQGAAREILGLEQELATIGTTLARYDKVQSSLDRLGERGYLLGIDPVGDGKAIIAVGNPDTARHTAVWVPGLGTTLDGVRGNVTRVQNLQEAADRLTRDRADDVATVMWLGYDAPELTTVAMSGRSMQGAEAFVPFIAGLWETHQGGDYHVTAVGHSYGSTVVAESALSPTAQPNERALLVDDIVVVGSPGMHTDRAADLKLGSGHVWAGAAEDDFVANPLNRSSGLQVAVNAGSPVGAYGIDMGHGTSPHEETFGANHFVTDTPGHSRYWDEDSLSLENQAAVVVGQYSKVALNRGHRPSDLMQ